MTSEEARVMTALLGIATDALPEGSDYDAEYPSGLCLECGTARELPEQQQCDVPGCYFVRIREAVADAERLLQEKS